MGQLCSKSLRNEKVNVDADPCAVGGGVQSSNLWTSRQADLGVESKRGSLEKQFRDQDDQQPDELYSNHVRCNNIRESDLDDYYDGIPRVPTAFSHKSRSMRSTQAAVAKVSEVSVRLGRAGTMGLEKAVEVLDVLGSSVTDLHSRSGFASGVISRGTKISILAFEVANTIMKGACLMHSLSESRICQLKEEVLPSEAVQKLVSKDMDELLSIVASDKREELAIFSGEVIRFGNRCKDPQWHNLDRYFLKQSREVGPRKQLKEDAESVTQQLLILVQYTAELYHELHALHRFEQDFQGKCRVEELKKQKKLVKKLKKRSLWSRSLEEIMEKLVDVVLFLHTEIRNNFDNDGQPEDAIEKVEDPVSKSQRLGPAGLALHYANIILQIDGILSLPDIKAEMEKTLEWLVPIASSTVKSHHGFGWVGEWANSGFEASDTSAEKADVIRIETLYHADKVKTEAYITDQLVWLHHLVSQSRISSINFSIKSVSKPPVPLPPRRKQASEVTTCNELSNVPTAEEHQILNVNAVENQKPKISKSLDPDPVNGQVDIINQVNVKG
uniref:DUF3475 domain-containing protein n=1 Tax=Chenopodium quinoa TaxID=63459 RepID=A0A803MVU9_CHEQI